MPVPVPLTSKQPAHLVIKKHLIQDGQFNPFQNLTRTLPVSPTGPPPSFGTREQWISSLPSWRRTKHRRIWEDDSRFVDQLSHQQDFQQGLAAAENASAIKGLRAEACLPPQFSLLPPVTAGSQISSSTDGDADDEMSPLENWANEMDVEFSHDRSLCFPNALEAADFAYDEDDKGAFPPVFEQSPGGESGHETSSSPLEPTTPFGDFVDRAVAAAHASVPYNPFQVHSFPTEMDKYEAPCYQALATHDSVPEVAKEPSLAPAPTMEVVTPTATSGYKKLAEPLSDWVANYVWKACTANVALPQQFSRPM